MSKPGGGWRALIYSFKVGFKIGFFNLFKTAFSKNTCKTCAYGMGGQKGGMINEEGSFPEICKKSIQAQLTDIQKPIPPTLFDKISIAQFSLMSGKKLEASGRLNTPLYKPNEGAYYKAITWKNAIALIVKQFKQTDPLRSFFYASGRSSNEAAFLLNIFARAYGTNHINNCSYYCHQASGVGMKQTIASGTATIQLEELKKADLIFVIGANPASNHPRFMTELMMCRRRSGNVVVINPLKEAGLVKFAVPSRVGSMLKGGSEIASHYIQPKIGGDIALLTGISKHVMENKSENIPFIQEFTENFEACSQIIESTTWEEIELKSGIKKTQIAEIGTLYMQSKAAVFSWAMGITHHLHGVENVKAIVNLALLRGMIGKPGAGLLPLRGHSNVQGIGSVGVSPLLKAQIIHNMEENLLIKIPESKGMDTLECIEAAREGRIDLAFMLGGNLYGANPDADFASEALGKTKLSVYLSTTLNAGHFNGCGQESIILPVKARDEETQTTTQESMFNFVRLSNGGINRLDNTWSEVDVVAEIASKTLPDGQIDFEIFKKHDHIRTAISKIIPGFEKLAELDSKGNEFTISGRIISKPVFPTETGKAKFSSVKIPITQTTKNEFLLMSIRSEGQFNTIVYDEEDIYRNQKERWIVLMNVQDMKALNLRSNDFIDLNNKTGRMRAVKVKPYDIPKGNLAAYYPEANILIPKDCDPQSKTPAFKAVQVEVVI